MRALLLDVAGILTDCSKRIGSDSIFDQRRSLFWSRLRLWEARTKTPVCLRCRTASKTSEISPSLSKTWMTLVLASTCLSNWVIASTHLYDSFSVNALSLAVFRFWDCRCFFCSFVSPRGGLALCSRFHSFCHNSPRVCPVSGSIAKALCSISPFPPEPMPKARYALGPYPSFLTLIPR